MQLSRLLCDFWVSDSMRAVYWCARSAQNVQRETKHSFSCVFHILSRLFQILFVPFSLLFVAKKRNTWKLWRISPMWNCVTFPRLATFGQDMRLLSVTFFSLRLGMSPFEQSFGPASLYLLCFRSNVGCLQRSSQIANALSKETNDPCKAQCCFSKAMSTYSKCRDLLDICSERRRMRKKQKKDGLNQIFWLLFDLFLRNLANLAVFSMLGSN